MDGGRVTRLETVSLADIDFSDLTYRVSSRSGVGELASSIHRIGLLVPPLLKPSGDRLTIVSGFLRLEACRRLGIETTGARMVPPDWDGLACAHCAVAENRCQRPLNPLETARAMALLAAAVADRKRLAAEAAVAGLPSNAGMIAKLLRVVKLPGAVQSRLADGTIGLAMALELGGHSEDFGTACAGMFGDLRMGLNRQREVLGLMTEISARDDVTPFEVFEMDDIQRVLGDADLDRPQKIGRIRNWLYHRRYPRLAGAEDAFRQNRRRLKLGENIQLKPPRFFESDRYAIHMRFRTVADLRTLVKRLESACDSAVLKELLRRNPESRGTR
jgi:ParB family chromosome partitioning protein